MLMMPPVVDCHAGPISCSQPGTLPTTLTPLPGWKETEPQLPSSGLPTDEGVTMDMEEGEAMQIRGGSASTSASHPSPAGSILFYVDDTDLMEDTGTGLPLLPHLSPPRARALLAQGSVTSPHVLAYLHLFSPFSQGAGKLHRKQTNRRRWIKGWW